MTAKKYTPNPLLKRKYEITDLGKQALAMLEEGQRKVKVAIDLGVSIGHLNALLKEAKEK